MVNHLGRNLEPYCDPVDRIIQQRLCPLITPRGRRHFEACRYKLKAVWYLKSSVVDLDKEYGTLIDGQLTTGNLDNLPLNEDGSRSYYPFFEALEFENLLSQAKACLDYFARAVGSQFDQNPSKLSKLQKVLRQSERSADLAVRSAASGILQVIAIYKPRLVGVVLDPGRNRKSIRDLVSHYEQAPIHFRIKGSGRSRSALVKSDHPIIAKLPNYGVPYLSRYVQYAMRNLIELSLTFSLDLARSRRRSSVST